MVHLASIILLSGVIRCSGKMIVAPVLILATNDDFGTYMAEILKTEGFNEFVLDSLAGENVTSSYLTKFDLIILAEPKTYPMKLNMVREYVKNGGKLIAFHPDPELAEIFGVVPIGKSISGGYIRIDTTTEQGKGLSSRLLQFHGNAGYYNLNGARSSVQIIITGISMKL